MRLWDDEIEGMRAEAREAVARTLPAMAEALGVGGPMPTEPVARVKRMREGFAATYAPVPEAEERRIAGVRCRVFRPPGRARAVYLHFHGGGMILGAPEMNDAQNLELCRSCGVAVVWSTTASHPSTRSRRAPTTGSPSRPGSSRTPSASSGAGGSSPAESRPAAT